MREDLAKNFNDFLYDTVALEGSVWQNFADDQQYQSDNRGSFHCLGSTGQPRIPWAMAQGRDQDSGFVLQSQSHIWLVANIAAQSFLQPLRKH